FEKDAYTPMRLIYAPNVPAELKPRFGRLDVRFEKFQNFRDFSFPRGVALRVGGQTFLREELGETLINPKQPLVPEGTANNAGWTPVGEQAPEVLKQLVREYFLFLR
ncbi:MAG: hypothetical protein AAB425_03900, partial [Bdellovibrionota bacterium]